MLPPPIKPTKNTLNMADYYVMQIIALKRKPEMQTFPGGTFLVVEIVEPIWDNSEPGLQWNISDPATTILMARMGMSPDGQLVYQYEGKRYLRKLRDHVEGRNFRGQYGFGDEYAGWPWGWRKPASDGIPGRCYYERMALRWYTGEYTPLKT